MTKKDQHEKILLNLEDAYIDAGYNLELQWDGPSNWEKYEHSIPRIIFLGKEAYSSCHHAHPSAVNETEFKKIIAEWASIIKSTLNCNPKYKDLQDAWESIAVVEVKKLDEGKTESPHADIEKFAWLGRAYLKQQIDLLDPHIIVCLGISSIDYFDIIYNKADYTLEEIRAREKIIFEDENCKCWLSNNYIVLRTYHPSYWIKNKGELSDSIKKCFSNSDVTGAFNDLEKSK